MGNGWKSCAIRDQAIQVVKDAYAVGKLDRAQISAGKPLGIGCALDHIRVAFGTRHKTHHDVECAYRFDACLATGISIEQAIELEASCPGFPTGDSRYDNTIEGWIAVAMSIPVVGEQT